MVERAFAEYLAQSSFDKKAENVVIIDLNGRSPVADYFVVLSASSDRQVIALAEHMAAIGREFGQRPLHMEGLQDGRWAVIDFGSVMVHVFQDYLREYYALESLWIDAPRTRVRDERLQLTATSASFSL